MQEVVVYLSQSIYILRPDISGRAFSVQIYPDEQFRQDISGLVQIYPDGHFQSRYIRTKLLVSLNSMCSFLVNGSLKVDQNSINFFQLTFKIESLIENC